MNHRDEYERRLQASSRKMFAEMGAVKRRVNSEGLVEELTPADAAWQPVGVEVVAEEEVPEDV